MSLGPDGRFETVEEHTESLSTLVRGLVSTRSGERVMRAEYGTEAVGRLFGDMADVESSVRSAINTWIPDVRVESIRIDSDGGASTIWVEFSSRSGDTASVGIGMGT